MAYFCLDCFNDIEMKHITYDEVECDWDFCERCGKNALCVICYKNINSETSNSLDI